MTIYTTKHFKKQYKKFPKKVQLQIRERIDLFSKNKKARILNVHKLKGKYKNCHSINITADIRIIYEEIENDAYLFIAIGTHSELYGK